MVRKRRTEAEEAEPPAPADVPAVATGVDTPVRAEAPTAEANKNPYEHLASLLKDKELFMAIVKSLNPPSIDDLLEFSADDWADIVVKDGEDTLKLSILDTKLLGIISEWYYQQDIDERHHLRVE